MGVLIETPESSFAGSEKAALLTSPVGVHRTNAEERRARRSLFILTILSNVIVLPIDSKVADIHAGIVATLTRNGTTIGPHDNWIAATALKYD